MEEDGNSAFLADHPIFSRKAQRFASLTNHKSPEMSYSHDGNLNMSHLMFPKGSPSGIKDLKK